MTVYTSCIVPAPNRRSRSYQVAAATDAGPAQAIAKGTGWANPSGTRLASVYFDSASATLSAEGIQALRKMVRDSKALGIPSVYVVGHTDTLGPMDYNRRLSARRARVVHNWIERNLQEAIFDKGTPQGELRPRFDEADRPGDWRNRRVDIIVE
jgi:OOP family OmpA-OmpF porin